MALRAVSMTENRHGAGAAREQSGGLRPGGSRPSWNRQPLRMAPLARPGRRRAGGFRSSAPATGASLSTRGRLHPSRAQSALSPQAGLSNV